MDNIDNISYFVLLLILFSAIISSSEIMGLLGFLFSGLVLFKFLFSKRKQVYKLEGYEKTFIVYFLIVTLSLFASTLFSLSLHGYIKTLTYVLFFFSASIFFKHNKNKILPTILFTCVLMSYESIVAIIQNASGVKEISGWQDMSNINPEEVVSRAYGTLKPYNPNLLAGYLLCGLSSFIYIILKAIGANRKKIALCALGLFFINLVAIIDTGCRGAYLGFLFFFPCLFLALGYYVKRRLGGFSNIKKRYKGGIVLGFLAFITFIFTNPAIAKRIESIFALRADSSISFRLNVYESAWHMFLDNPFLGIGVGNQNFREIYGLYMKTGFDALGSYCVPLEIAVESGIFALIVFALFLTLVCYKCFRLRHTTYKVLALCVILMIASTMGHGLFDTIWFRPQVQFLFWTNIAMLKATKIRIPRFYN